MFKDCSHKIIHSERQIVLYFSKYSHNKSEVVGEWPSGENAD